MQTRGLSDQQHPCGVVIDPAHKGPLANQPTQRRAAAPFPGFTEGSTAGSGKGASGHFHLSEVVAKTCSTSSCATTFGATASSVPQHSTTAFPTAETDSAAQWTCGPLCSAHACSPLCSAHVACSHGASLQVSFNNGARHAGLGQEHPCGVAPTSTFALQPSGSPGAKACARVATHDPQRQSPHKAKLATRDSATPKQVCQQRPFPRGGASPLKT